MTVGMMTSWHAVYTDICGDIIYDELHVHYSVLNNTSIAYIMLPLQFPTQLAFYSPLLLVSKLALGHDIRP